MGRGSAWHGEGQRKRADNPLYCPHSYSARCLSLVLSPHSLVLLNSTFSHIDRLRGAYWKRERRKGGGWSVSLISLCSIGSLTDEGFGKARRRERGGGGGKGRKANQNGQAGQGEISEGWQ